jgi:hypothetical protein
MYEDDEIINILNTVAEQSSNSKQSLRLEMEKIN